MHFDRQVDDQVAGTGDGVLPCQSNLAGVGRDVHEPFKARLTRIDVEAANQVRVFHQPRAGVGAALVPEAAKSIKPYNSWYSACGVVAGSGALG